MTENVKVRGAMSKLAILDDAAFIPIEEYTKQHPEEVNAALANDIPDVSNVSVSSSPMIDEPVLHVDVTIDLDRALPKCEVVNTTHDPNPDLDPGTGDIRLLAHQEKIQYKKAVNREHLQLIVPEGIGKGLGKLKDWIADVKTLESDTMPAPETQEPNQGPGYDPDYRRQRIGNNRYHVPKAVAKKRKAIAKASRRRNRRG